MKQSKSYLLMCMASLALMVLTLNACRKDGNPNNLPDVNPANYAGKIDGYTSSEEIFASSLIAYWSFDDTWNEMKTGTAPTQMLNNSFVGAGVRGKAAALNAGFLYYATQFPMLKTDSLKSWTISMWFKVKNNGSKRTMLFQLARPGMFNGNINVALNTQSYQPANDSVLRIQPTFAAVNANTGASNFQDNLNNVLDKINLNDWVHLVLTYNITTGTFNNWANAVKVGNFPNRGTVNLFKSWEPSELILGSNYNGIPGKAVNTDVTFAPMAGQLDEIRIYNTVLPDAHIMALYKLGKANK